MDKQEFTKKFQEIITGMNITEVEKTMYRNVMENFCENIPDGDFQKLMGDLAARFRESIEGNAEKTFRNGNVFLQN